MHNYAQNCTERCPCNCVFFAEQNPTTQLNFQGENEKLNLRAGRWVEEKIQSECCYVADVMIAARADSYEAVSSTYS